MADASYVRASFVGGEFSKAIQGRYDRPEYPTGLNVCQNGFPIETGAWVRRPGFQHCAVTRNGNPGRLIRFDFKASQPYVLEFTDGHLRFFDGTTLVDTNDPAVVTGITLDPAPRVLITLPRTWTENDQVYLTDLGPSAAILHNRQFAIQPVNTALFALIDPLTGAGPGQVSYIPTPLTRLRRILDIATPYIGGAWARGQMQLVQTETTAYLLNNGTPPQALIVETQPTPDRYATFSLNPALFQDGPYLDPFTNGVMVTPDIKTGIVTFVMTLPTYDATKAYPAGAFVTSADISYVSLVDQNINFTPAVSPTKWQATSAAEAVAPGGLTASDIGRLVRLFSEPDIWDKTHAYAANDIVSYNPSGVVGATTYWKSLTAGNTNNTPGADVVNWSLLPTTGGVAIWTWGRIVNIGNYTITTGGGGPTTGGGQLTVGVITGNMSSGGGLVASFDGVNSKVGASCSSASVAFATVNAGYVGRNFSGVGARQIGKATIYPASDLGFASADASFLAAININLRGNSVAPASSSDGTLLGSASLSTNQTAPVTIISSDTTTAWNYAWIEVQATFTFAGPTTIYSAQVLLYAPDSEGSGGGGTITGPGFALELLGSPLLYFTPIRTWRLGAYSQTTGWPTCGTYSDGRLWLSGSIPNRIDASVSNGLHGISLDFAPTDPVGNVAASSAITYVFNAPSTNSILWMTPDQQGIICGTSTGEWLVTAPTTGGLSPFNISARRVTHIGCANIEPRRTEHTLIFVQRYLRKIMEYFADVFSGKFTAPHITFTWKHLTNGSIDDIAYQQELAPIVWVQRAGALLGCTYKRNTLTTSQGPDIAGGHSHRLGDPNQTIESIAMGSSATRTSEALMVITGSTTGARHVQLMMDLIDENTTMVEANFLDDCIVPTATTSMPASVELPYGAAVLMGLSAHEGKTVAAWLDGMDCGDYVVSNGAITVPYGDGVSGGTANGQFTPASINGRMLVGFPYASRGQLVRPNSPQETGTRNGPAFGKKRRSEWIAVQLQASQGVSFGSSFDNMIAAQFRFDDDQPYPATQLFSGVYRDNLADDYSFASMPCWEITRPYPCTITAIGAFPQTQDV